MSFKWPGAPSAFASEHELADFGELLAWQNGLVSLTELSRVMGRLSENDYSTTPSDGDVAESYDPPLGGVPEEDESDRIAEEAFAELGRRCWACREHYPYKMSSQGYTLRLSVDQTNDRHLLYNFLLLATRLDMKNMRRHGDIDGTALFERVAALAARGYLGCRADSLVFGTSAPSATFRDRVNTLCLRLQEGGGFLDRYGGSHRVRDGKLDVVAWKPFSDRRAGKLIAFGQCKTGTSYRDSLTQLQPDSFFSKWVLHPPLLMPVRMFFVSEALPDADWGRVAPDAGILFDRCRVIDFVDTLDRDLVIEVARWSNAAAASTRLPELPFAFA